MAIDSGFATNVQQRLGKKRDDITAILNQRTAPNFKDVADAGTQRFQSIINPSKYKAPGSVQDVSNANLAADLSPHMSEFDILTKAAEAGHADSKAVLETFKQFAPEADHLAKLVQFASHAPEEINPSNAASFAARASQQLGIGDAVAASRASKGTAAVGGVQSLPLVDENGLVDETVPAPAPTVSGTTVASLVQPQGTPPPKPHMGGAPVDMTGLGRPPVGFMWAKDKNGQIRQVAVPGGPEDPTRKKGKSSLTMPEQNKLAGMGTNLSNLERITGSFSPDYAGYTYGFGAPSVTVKGWGWLGDKGITEADWWQDYQSFVNQVRHDQFGAALTATEKAEFEKAMVTKNIDPRLAKKNLDRQTQIAHAAAMRMAKSMAAGGKNVEQISLQTGIPQEDILAGTSQGKPADKDANGWSDADEARMKELEAQLGGQ